MEDLKLKLEQIPDSYFDFVFGIVSFAKRKETRLQAILDYLDSHPDALSSDVIRFVSYLPDFSEDAVVEKVS